jgi:hypothetical protein
MTKYRETFRRHRVVFVLPVLISVAFAAWFAFGTPVVYRSTANLWIDNGPAQGASVNSGSGQGSSPNSGPMQGSSLNSLSVDALEASTGLLSAPVGPAPIESQTLTAELAVPAFDIAVGDDSPLPRYLASGVRHGFSPAVLLQHGTPSIPYQVAQSIKTQVKASSPGPEVLHLEYTGPTPAIARSVLTSLIAHLRTASNIYGTDFAVTEQQFFQQAQATALSAVANATASASSYKSQHPSATTETDPTYAVLRASVKQTTAALSAASAATASTRQGTAGLSPLIDVIDPPSLPTGPTVGSRQTDLSLLGGLAAGLLMSFLAVAVCTPTDRPWDAELSAASWLRLRWDRRAYAAASRAAAAQRARRTRLPQRLRRSF